MTLGRGRAPNYRLKEAYGGFEEGTFLRPIEFCHLPREVRIQAGNYYDQETYVMCYTSKGIISFPRKVIEET